MPNEKSRTLTCGLLTLFAFSVTRALPQYTKPLVPQSADNTSLRFAVASIKSAGPQEDGWRLEFIADGFRAKGVSLRDVIEEAYGIYENDRILGGPKWLTTQRFDIEAKIDTDEMPAFQSLTLVQRRIMLQMLLSDRTHLKIHHTDVQLPAYALVAGRHGAKLHDSSAGTLHQDQIKGIEGLVTRSDRSRLEVQGFSMPALAQSLSSILGRTVIDKTGLFGRYDFSLRWAPEDRSTVLSTQENQPQVSEWPSIFTAIEEQLGLRLEPVRAPVDTLTIDQVEFPSPN